MNLYFDDKNADAIYSDYIYADSIYTDVNEEIRFKIKDLTKEEFFCKRYLPLGSEFKITKIKVYRHLNLVFLYSGHHIFKVEEIFNKKFFKIFDALRSKEIIFLKKVLPIVVFLDYDYNFIQIIYDTIKNFK